MCFVALFLVAACAKDPAGEPPKREPLPITGIRINELLPEDLVARNIPGLDTGLAEKLTAYRDVTGPFTNYDDLRKVEGMTAEVIAALRKAPVDFGEFDARPFKERYVTASLAGTVIDERERPIRDAMVMFRPPDWTFGFERYATTDDSGIFSFGELFPREIVLIVEANGFDTLIGKKNLASGLNRVTIVMEQGESGAIEFRFGRRYLSDPSIDSRAFEISLFQERNGRLLETRVADLTETSSVYFRELIPTTYRFKIHATGFTDELDVRPNRTVTNHF